MSSELFFLLLSRVGTFFLFSPLFVSKSFPLVLRIGLSVIFTLALALPLGQAPAPNPPVFAAALIQEAAIGYIIGFFFSLLFEGAKLAGQIIGTLAGFSATELLDPSSSSADPLISKMFLVTIAVLLLAMDFHHLFLHTLVSVPLGASFTLESLIEGTSRIFSSALTYGALPFLTLSLLTITLAITSRLFPSLPIFWVGFPLQLLVGFFIIAASLPSFPELLTKAVTDLVKLFQSINL